MKQKSVKFERHQNYVPEIESEGVFLKDVPHPKTESNKDDQIAYSWCHNLKPWERVYYHQTLSSARKFQLFVPTQAPNDNLDLMLSTRYNHETEHFADKQDVYLQPETLGEITWRRLRNYRILKPERSVPLGHPLLISGVKERRHPCNVKLMNSSHHSPQTNAGYVRQEKDGNFFFY